MGGIIFGAPLYNGYDESPLDYTILNIGKEFLSSIVNLKKSNQIWNVRR